MHRHVERDSHPAFSVVRDLMRWGRALLEWNRERRVRLKEEREALREVGRSASYRQ